MFHVFISVLVFITAPHASPYLLRLIPLPSSKYAAEVFLLQQEAASLRRQNQAYKAKAESAAGSVGSGGGTSFTPASRSLAAARSGLAQRDCFKCSDQVGGGCRGGDRRGCVRVLGCV